MNYNLKSRFGQAFFLALCIPFLCLAAMVRSEESDSAIDFQTPMERATISFRLGLNIWEDSERFDDLLAIFDRNPGVADELTFFTDPVHTPAPVDQFLGRISVMKERIARAKAHGYKSGINILCTIGHHPEALPQAIGPEYPRAVTIDGQTAAGTLCMNQPIFRDRIVTIYTAMAEADPDYIWIDDDVRCGHWTDSAGNGGSCCFCDTCMARISEKLGRTITREELCGSMGDPAIRAVIHESHSDSINELFGLIEKTVHKVRPGLPLGFMTGERYEEGYDFARWSRTLAGPSGSPVWWRPGGGFYTQDNIGELVGKAHEIGRQVSLLPADVRVIQSEIENFPYAPLQKSRHITALEAAVDIAAGSTGVAFNVVTGNHESVSYYEPLIAELAAWRPFYDRLVGELGRKPTAGVFPVWRRTDADNPAGNAINQLMRAIADVGIPVAYRDENSPVVLVSSGYLTSITSAEADDILSRGVYLDHDGLSILNDGDGLARGGLTGAVVDKELAVDSIEQYTNDELNGEFAGMDRDQRQSFWRDRAYGFRLTDPGARVLARLVDYTGKETASASMVIYENALGGRVAVSGYHPWNYFQSYPKQAQLKRLMRWLSSERLVAWVDSFERGNLWVRVDAEGNPAAIVFFNATYDATRGAIVKIRTGVEEVTFYDRLGRESVIRASEADGVYRAFELPEVGAWEMVLLVIGK